jgi:hypothetical protein
LFCKMSASSGAKLSGPVIFPMSSKKLEN